MTPQTVSADHSAAVNSIQALSTNPLTEQMISHEAFESAASASERRCIINRAGLECGVFAYYDDADGSIEIATEDLPEATTKTLFACGARPAHMLTDIVAFKSVGSFYKALYALAKAQKHHVH